MAPLYHPVPLRRNRYRFLITTLYTLQDTFSDRILGPIRPTRYPATLPPYNPNAESI